MSGSHQVVIVGGGFGGLYAAKALRKAPVTVTLLDRRNHHTFQPLLYQVATGGLSPANISSPLRGILGRQRNARVLLATVVGFDLRRRQVLVDRGEPVSFDSLILATGATHHYFGHDDWAPHAPGLKTIEDATAMRRRILYAFEAAERETDPGRRRAWLNFVVVGAGPTGVELAGALGELAHDTLRHEFRRIDPTEAQILLVEGGDRVLPTYVPELSASATRSLERIGVTVQTGATVTAIASDRVTVRRNGREETVPTRCVLWAAGVKASPLGRALADAAGAEVDAAGRVAVDQRLSVGGHANVMVIGDLAAFRQDGEQLPGVAQVAIQMGRYAADRVQRQLAGYEPSPFRYEDLGSLATIGRSAAVADFGALRFSGWLAWVLWLVIHVWSLIEFRNRILVTIQWAWSYFTRNRGARLIAGPDPDSGADVDALGGDTT